MRSKFVVFTKKILSTFIKIARGYFISIGIVVTVLPILLFLALSRYENSSGLTKLTRTATSPKEHTRLEWNLQGELLESYPDFSARFWDVFVNRKTTFYLPEIRRALEAAATNKKIDSLLINLADLSGSSAEFSELRRALIKFKTSKKPIYVHVSQLDDRSLLLASAGDAITLAPTGEVTLTGPVFQLAYFGDALKKLGITVEVIRHGKYKSAFEPFVSNKPTKETLEMYGSIEASLLEHQVEAIASGRKKDTSLVRSWFKKTLFTPEEARTAGIIDSLGYFEDVVKSLDDSIAPAQDAKINNNVMDFSDFVDYSTKPTQILAGSSEDKTGKKIDQSGEAIALIEAIGEIHMSGAGSSSQGIITADRLLRELDWAGKEKNAKAVVIRVSSPGGSATASDLIWHGVKKLAAKKPVVVSMGAYAASGGYYISAPASWILAEPTTITGSIGVIGMQLKMPAFASKYGVSFHTVTSSDRARMINPGSLSSTEDKALLSRSIDSVYSTFITKVAEGRELTVDQVDQLGQGRVYSGIQAEKLDLVDELGGVTDAFRIAKEFGGLDVNSLYPVLRYEEDRPSLADCLSNPIDLMECLQTGTTTTRVFGEVEKIKRLIKTDRILAIWPGWLGDYFH